MKLALALFAVFAVTQAVDVPIAGAWFTCMWQDNTFTQYTDNPGTLNVEYNYHGSSCYFHTDKTQYVNKDWLYVYYYQQLGCVAEPTAFMGVATDEVVNSHMPNSGYGSSFGNPFSSQSAFFHWGGYGWGENKCEYNAGYEYVDDCTVPPVPSVIAGCVDTYYAVPHLIGEDFTMYLPWDLDFVYIRSMYSIKGSEILCGRQCTAVDCNVYDECRKPCIGQCDDGMYCSSSTDVNGDDNTFVCENSQYGSVSIFTTIDYTGFASNSPPLTREVIAYDEPTIGLFENAFVGDLARATADVVPSQAYVINDYQTYSNFLGIINVYFTVNVDVVNRVMGTTYTAEDIQNYYFNGDNGIFRPENQRTNGILGGVFTQFMVLDNTFPTDVNPGGSFSMPAGPSEEWKSVVLHSSWFYTPSSSPASTATVVAWLVAAFAAVVALL